MLHAKPSVGFGLGTLCRLPQRNRHDVVARGKAGLFAEMLVPIVGSRGAYTA